ncbi:MAG: hypothetical protein JKY19_02220 [Alcanivoracaceae bacterium]|nr:hypothetical protein [Alcanivoracaceae bacterium]
MIKKNRKIKLTTLVVAMLTASYSLYAIDVEQSKNGISFNSLEQSHYKLTLITPNKERYTFDLNNKNFNVTADMLNLSSFNDGRYKYELSPVITTGDLGTNVRELNNHNITQEFKKEFSVKNETYSGTFSIVGNKLTSNIEEELSLNKDFLINDDLIVDGSACIGFDCVNGESFGFDTLRLKENNLRIKFDDTSIAASFPGNDWQLTANDSANGGANKFSIDDITGGRTVFTVEAGAPSHSLYVDDGGRIGIRTSVPSTEIHVVDGDTPTLRLQQDGSSGFAPQTWDVAGNETNFFVRDVTNGSTLPFRIRPDAPTSSIDVAASGNVGIGDASPDASLNIERSDGTAQLLIEETNGSAAARELLKLSNNGGSFITFENQNNANKSWYFTHENSAGTSFNITHDDSVGAAMRLTTGGNMTITGTLTTGGVTCGGGCDLVFSDSYKVPTIEEHAAEMWNNSYLPNVGPTLENTPFNLTEKTGGMLNELEKAHIYIEQLNTRLNNKENELIVMKSQFDNLEQRLAKLEIK